MSVLIHAVRISLPDIRTESEACGLFTRTQPGCSAVADSYTIDCGAGNAKGFRAGRQIMAAGNYYRILMTVTDRYIVVDQPIPDGLSNATIAQQSELRWSEEALTLAAGEDAWKSGLLPAGGLGDLAISADAKNGPAAADFDGFDLVANNIAPVGQLLRTAGLVLNGCPCELVEFSGDETDSKAYYQKTLFSGLCETPKEGETEYSIPVKCAVYGRDAKPQTVIDNGQYEDMDELLEDAAAGIVRGNYPYANEDQDGEAVPVTCGEIDKAKFIRTAGQEFPLTINGSTADGGYYHTYFSNPADATQYRYKVAAADLDYGDVSLFPVVDKDSNTYPVRYSLKFMNAVSGAWQKSEDFGQTWAPHTPDGSERLTALEGCYVQVQSGDGADTGRMIDEAKINTGSASSTTNYSIIDLTVAMIFQDTLKDSADASDPDTSWCTVDDVMREYSADEWECKAFLDEEGEEL